jgi:hypothetical protein
MLAWALIGSLPKKAHKHIINMSEFGVGMKWNNTKMPGIIFIANL